MNVEKLRLNVICRKRLHIITKYNKIQFIVSWRDENLIVLPATHPILDEENNLIGSITKQAISSVTLSLLSRSGDVEKNQDLTKR